MIHNTGRCPNIGPRARGGEMKISVIHKTSDYRGDHAADVSHAYELKPGETVEALMTRVFGESPSKGHVNDHIELRYFVESVTS